VKEDCAEDPQARLWRSFPRLVPALTRMKRQRFIERRDDQESHGSGTTSWYQQQYVSFKESDTTVGNVAHELHVTLFVLLELAHDQPE